MNLLCKTDLIEFLPPEPEALAVAIKKFQRIIDAHGSPANWLQYAVAEGLLEVSQVNYEGKPAFLVWFQVTPEGRLFIDSAQSVAEKALFPVLVEGMEQLAKQRHCKAIEFRTLRRGMVHQAMQYGYRPSSLIMTKSWSS